MTDPQWLPSQPPTSPDSTGSLTKLMVTPGLSELSKACPLWWLCSSLTPAALHLTTNVREYWFGKQWQRPNWDSSLCTIIIHRPDLLHTHWSTMVKNQYLISSFITFPTVSPTSFHNRFPLPQPLYNYSDGAIVVAYKPYSYVSLGSFLPLFLS